MIAIHTKYIKTTDIRGSRIKAYTAGWGEQKGFQVTIGYDDSLSTLGAHFKAVKALVKKYDLDWDLAAMRYGDSADGRGFSFCFSNSVVEA
jgi:hypothetical protein